MKFGRLVYNYTGETIAGKDGIYNIGDNFQTFAIDNVYKRMGIGSDDIININACEMKNYDGEYVIVLVAGYASHYKRFNQLPPSGKIIPLFFSFEMSDESCDDIVPYLKEHAPIGCRDEATMQLLRRKGIEAYTSGCLTITLPKRIKEPTQKKVFFIDIPSSLESYIPEELKENCEYVTQEGIIKQVPMTEEERLEIDKLAQDTFVRYKEEATLVVTSRLHAAAPCLALGIPVILAIENIDSRFSWLDKLIPLYDYDHFEQIDWNPVAVDIEPLKEQILNNVCGQLTEVYNAKKDIYDLSTFWEKRNRVCYNYKLYKRLEIFKKQYGTNDNFKYIIWGAGVHGRLAYSMMKEMYPNAVLICVIDKYVRGKMFDCDIKGIDGVDNLSFDCAIVTTHPGRFEATDKLVDMGIENICYFISKDMPEQK